MLGMNRFFTSLVGLLFITAALITWSILEAKHRPIGPAVSTEENSANLTTGAENSEDAGETTNQPAYLIALYGDSMQDSMQEHLAYLTTALEEKYSQTEFTIYNYGIGAQDAEAGLARFNNQFGNRGRTYQAITAVQPDVIIIGSFAYNPFNPPSLERHTAALTALVQKAQQVTNSVYLIVEIAPLRAGFAQGPKGVAFSPEQATENSQNVIDQLENTVIIGRSLGVPLINVYADSIKTPEDKEGFRQYISQDDGIHPSAQGYALMAEKIVETIELP